MLLNPSPTYNLLTAIVIVFRQYGIKMYSSLTRQFRGTVAGSITVVVAKRTSACQPSYY